MNIPNLNTLIFSLLGCILLLLSTFLRIFCIWYTICTLAYSQYKIRLVHLFACMDVLEFLQAPANVAQNLSLEKSSDCLLVLPRLCGQCKGNLPHLRQLLEPSSRHICKLSPSLCRMFSCYFHFLCCLLHNYALYKP